MDVSSVLYRTVLIQLELPFEAVDVKGNSHDGGKKVLHEPWLSQTRTPRRIARLEVGAHLLQQVEQLGRRED